MSCAKRLDATEVTIAESESIFALFQRLSLTIHPDEESLPLAFDLAHLTQPKSVRLPVFGARYRTDRRNGHCGQEILQCTEG